jgi:RNA polymerase sigma factor (sigma-70 family)
VAPPAPDFASIYEEHVWQVYGFLAYLVRSREEAEDLTQLTFERALRAFGRYDPKRAQPGTWLLTIARNLLIDRYRSDAAAPRPEPLHDVAEQHLPAVTAEPSLGLDADLAMALSGLEPRAREVLALRFGGDLNGPEIAQVTGLTLANVQQILSRTLRRLRSELGERDEQERGARGREPADPGG